MSRDNEIERPPHRGFRLGEWLVEPDLGRIYPGMTARVLTDSAPGRPYRGHVGFISPLAEFTPKTVETADLRRPGSALTPQEER